MIKGSWQDEAFHTEENDLCSRLFELTFNPGSTGGVEVDGYAITVPMLSYGLVACDVFVITRMRGKDYYRAFAGGRRDFFMDLGTAGDESSDNRITFCDVVAYLFVSCK